MADEELDILELEENLADVEKPPELPNGVYDGEVQDVISGTSASGNDKWDVRVRIPPENIPPDISEHYEDGALLTYNRLMKPKRGNRRALYALRKFLEAIGIDSNTTTVDPNEWMGRPCRVMIRSSVYNGEARAGIVAFEAAEAAPATKPAPKARGRK